MAAVTDDVGQMLMQRSAECDVEHLGTAADAQQRHPPAQRGGEQGELPGVPVAGRFVGDRVRPVSIGRRVDVPAAGDDQCVDPVEHPGGDIGVDRLRWQQAGDTAGQRHPVEIDTRQETGVDIPDPAAGLLPVGGQADHRPDSRAARNVQNRAPSPSR